MVELGHGESRLVKAHTKSLERCKMKQTDIGFAGRSRAENLAKLRDKISRVDVSTGSSGFMRIQDGRNIIRILPQVGKMEYFFQTVGRHMIPPDGKKFFYCPKFTSEGEKDCPICEYVEELYKTGDKVNKALASELRVKRMFWMNVIDRANEKSGPQIYTPGVTVFGAVSSLIGDPDYGDIFDLEDGIDLIIEKSGKGLDTEYQVKTKRSSTPLSDDPAMVKKWITVAKDLSYVEVSNDKEEDKELSVGHAVYVLPYDRLDKEFGSISDMDEDDEEEEEVKPKKRVVAVEDDEDDIKPLKRTVVDLDDSDADEDDEDDEEKEDVVTPSRRIARRRPH
jgi:hypothetical protein